MAAADTLEKVLQLKYKLKETSEGKTLLKTLKKLQNLDITLDILAETGIGKTVNAFRKHGDAGDVAKTLVLQWKKLVPKEPSSVEQEIQESVKALSKKEETQKKDRISSCLEGNSGHAHLKSESKKSSIETRKRVKTHSTAGSKYKSGYNKDDANKSKKEPSLRPSPSRDSHKSHLDKTKCQPDGKKSTDGNLKETKAKKLQKSKSCKDTKALLEGDESKDGIGNEMMYRTKNKPKITDYIHEPESDKGSKSPPMSFESYLNYDVKVSKRKRAQDERKTKKVKPDNEDPEMVISTSASNDTNVKPSKSAEEPVKKVSTGSVMDLLNVPLPAVLPDCEDISSFSYVEKKIEVEVPGVCEEASIFTGQRLNRKMQVYSGTKTMFLPTMMTLYQQCIRALQNNIDLLYDIGGVPFDILEPVFERCTAEQLLRIEEFNPGYIGLTDHLWERHCLKDFRNEKLKEYESWREMYLRLFEEREKKLKRLTKSIVSAHSGKPKGRQVKLAFINSVAKPPRNVRIQQEIHGTAGPLPLPNTFDKTSVRAPESRMRHGHSDAPRPSSSSSTSSQGQDPKRMRRVAPMMAKSLRAFKKQLGRR